jgi:hypothetical protein
VTSKERIIVHFSVSLDIGTRKVATMLTLKELHSLSEDCGLTQYRWAVLAGMTPARLNLAINEHIALRADELNALEQALRRVVAEKAPRLVRFAGIESEVRAAV